MANNDIVGTLNDLVAACKDTEYVFTDCAKHVESPELRTFFTQHAADAQRAANELQTYVVQYGGEPGKGGSATGALHRGWFAVRASLVGYTDHAMLEECERDEDHALARYRKALKNEALPEALRAVVERQCLAVQREHDRVKAWRDRTPA